MRNMILNIVIAGLGLGMAGTTLACGPAGPGCYGPPYYAPGCGRFWTIYPGCHGLIVPYGISGTASAYTAGQVPDGPPAMPQPRLTGQQPPAPPPPATGTAASQPLAKTDKLNGQRTCPVTGEQLGEMGTPIPVTLKGQVIYVCCQGCVAKVQRNPDEFLAKVAAQRAGTGTPLPPDGKAGAPGDDE